MENDRIQKFENFMQKLFETSRKVHNYDNKPRKYGTDDILYMVEVHTIRRIGRKPDITITEIASATDRTKGAVSLMIDKLVDKDLIIKGKDPSDSRRVILTLTKKGQRVFDFHEKKDNDAYEYYLKGFEDIPTEVIKNTTEVLDTFITLASKKYKDMK